MTTWMREQPIPEPDPREAKLPAWARDMMARCRRIAQEAQSAARDARLSTNPEGSGAVLDYHGEIPVGLGERPNVTFKVPGSRGHERYITVRQESGHPERLRIMGAESIVLRSHASNVVTVELEQ